jgi:hypothetical protein
MNTRQYRVRRYRGLYLLAAGLFLALVWSTPVRGVVTTTPDWISYNATGADKSYIFHFGVWDSSEVRVLIVDASGVPDLQTEHSDYTVALPNDDGWLTPGGTVTFTRAPAAGTRVYLCREVDYGQAANYADAAELSLANVQEDLDRAAVRDQQLLRWLGRSLRTPEGDVRDMNLPAAAVRAHTWLGFDAQGDMTTGSQTGTVLTAAWTAIVQALATAAQQRTGLADLGVDPNWIGTVRGAPTAGQQAGARATLGLDTDDAPAFAGLAVDGNAVSVYGGQGLSDANAARESLRKHTPGLNVRHYGARGDGVMDDAAALNAAVAAAQAAGYRAVDLPAGTYRVDTPVLVPGAVGVLLRGEGKMATALVAGRTMTAVVYLSGTSQIYGGLRDLTVDANRVGAYCLNAPQASDWTISGVRLLNAGTAGLSAAYCWCSRIEDTTVTGCADGLRLGRAANNVRIGHSAIYGNTGTGLVLGAAAAGSAGICISSTDFESNAVAAIHAFNVRNLSVQDAYFEANGTTGWAVTSPVTARVRAEIILAANTAATGFDNSYPCTGVTIAGCYFNTSVTDPNAAIWAAAATRLAVRDNVQYASGVPLIARAGKYAWGEVLGLEMSNNYTDANELEIQGGLGTATTDNLFAYTWRRDRAQPANYFPQNFLGYAALATGGGSWGGTLTRAAGSYRGLPIADLYDSDSKSIAWGCTLDIANNYPQLLGRWVWFGCWEKHTGNIDLALSLPDGYDRTDYAAGTGLWQFRARLVAIPHTATTLSFGVQKIGTADAHLYVTPPMLCEIGTPYDGAATPAIVWAAAAAPGAGTWAVGDVVWHSAPASGQPPFWICGTAPHTFLAAANLP